MRHDKSGAGIEIEIQIEILKIGRDTRIREKIFLIVFEFMHRKVHPIPLELLVWQE
jgi:hypothetical protein